MERILVTGAFGTVGSAVVEELVSLDWQVIASDRHGRAHGRAAEHYEHSDIVGVHWCDLTDPDDVVHLVEHTRPDAVVHLAALIPPECYQDPHAAHEVNVDGTRHLVRACEAAEAPPRLVQASSMTVYGPRNPHAGLGLLTPQTPTRPRDAYGRQRVLAEDEVRNSSLDWVILRLGGVVGPRMGTGRGLGALHFTSLLPGDGNMHTVDVRDVARAFAEAALRDVVNEVLLIAGDDTHRRKQADVQQLLEVMGLSDAPLDSRPGDPNDDDCWFASDWMDTTASQAALEYQQVTWDDLLADAAEAAGIKRHARRLAAPFLHALLSRRVHHTESENGYADVWAAIEEEWGPEALDGTAVE